MTKKTDFPQNALEQDDRRHPIEAAGDLASAARSARAGTLTFDGRETIMSVVAGRTARPRCSV